MTGFRLCKKHAKTCKKHQNEPVNALFQLLNLYIAETSVLSKFFLNFSKGIHIVQYLYLVKLLALKAEAITLVICFG
jgi:hypothetical protein